MNDILLLTGIVFALSFLLSVKFNRRRTEDSTHPVWSLILIQLCGSNLGRLQPVPQYRLYFSAVDFTDLDPNETISGSDVEVIPDFCILLHRAVLVRVEGPLRSLLANIQSTYLPSRAIKITSTFIPLLVELKRPVSRNCRDIDEFMSGLGTMMKSAQSQAEGQAHCLFSIPNFHRQMHVVLLAAVGEWWSFWFVPRSNFSGKTFNGNKYVFDVNDRLEEEERNNPLEEDEPKLMDPDLIHEMRNLIAHAGETPAQIKDRHDAERDARQRRRAQRNMIRQHNEDQLQEFIDKTQEIQNEPGIYPDLAINEYSQRRSACDADWKLRWKFQREFMESELGSRVALEDRADWSGVMRLGSKTSEYYLFQIRNYLNQFARDNVEEDDISQ
ncbi:hypothetical protein F5879DRAFT_1064898 [Lentinula edodes]|uniref:Uncharacterized protein n=1 Tax=Lentinula edodes TaxID=5353 RepID=A0A1Q3EG52_LENED|nr:hypothetical protein F5879DRAFT_1064898 [Lentinula edodes]GAW06197.1 hypothetical protein LENED_008100 [Lentinula edodes]